MFEYSRVVIAVLTGVLAYSTFWLLIINHELVKKCTSYKERLDRSRDRIKTLETALLEKETELISCKGALHMCEGRLHDR